MTVCSERAREQGLLVVVLSIHPGGWKEQMSVCTVSCQVGPERGSHRHKGPNGVTKDVQEAPLRLGEPQRGSPLRCQPAGGHSQHSRARVVAAEPCGTGWDTRYSQHSGSHTDTNTHAYMQECTRIGPSQPPLHQCTYT